MSVAFLWLAQYEVAEADERTQRSEDQPDLEPATEGLACTVALVVVVLTEGRGAHDDVDEQCSQTRASQHGQRAVQRRFANGTGVGTESGGQAVADGRANDGDSSGNPGVEVVIDVLDGLDEVRKPADVASEEVEYIADTDERVDHESVHANHHFLFCLDAAVHKQIALSAHISQHPTPSQRACAHTEYIKNIIPQNIQKWKVEKKSSEREWGRSQQGGACADFCPKAYFLARGRA